MDSKPKKTQEPYSPTNTPNPPQDIDPSRLPENNSDNNLFPKEKKKDSKTSVSNSGKKTKPKRSGDSEIEIDDKITR